MIKFVFGNDNKVNLKLSNGICSIRILRQESGRSQEIFPPTNLVLPVEPTRPNARYIPAPLKGAGAIMLSGLVLEGWKLPSVVLIDNDDNYLFEIEVIFVLYNKYRNMLLCMLSRRKSN